MRFMTPSDTALDGGSSPARTAFVRRKQALVAVALALWALSAAGACSSSSGSTDNGPDAAAPGDDASDGPALDEFQPPADTGPQDPSFDNFDDPGQCGDWIASDAVLTWRPTGAHGSPGACEICISDAGGSMYKLVVVPAGSYALDALVSREDGGTADASWTESLAFAHADGTDAGTSTGSGPLGFAYAPAHLNGSTADGVRVVMRIGPSDSCMLVDDVRLSAH
jgi:hypothetical protein